MSFLVAALLVLLGMTVWTYASNTGRWPLWLVRLVRLNCRRKECRMNATCWKDLTEGRLFLCDEHGASLATVTEAMFNKKFF